MTRQSIVERSRLASGARRRRPDVNGGQQGVLASRPRRLSSSGQLSGSVRGHATGPWGELFAGVTGAFTASGGFASDNRGTVSDTDTGRRALARRVRAPDLPALRVAAEGRRRRRAAAASPTYVVASTMTQTANATEITPFIVKNAASSRRKSPGRTSRCS